MGVTADFVEAIAYRSDNPSFQTIEFRKALSDFRRYRYRTPNKTKFDLNTEVEAIKRKLGLSDDAYSDYTNKRGLA